MTAFTEKIERFVHVNYDHVSKKEDSSGETVLVFDPNGCFLKVDSPLELIPIDGLHVEVDDDEFCEEKLYFLVDDETGDYEQLINSVDFWAKYKEDLELYKSYQQVYAMPAW